MRWMKGVLVCLAVACSSAPAWAATYALDPDHTTIGFKIRHLFSFVRGTFDQFEGTCEYEPGHPETWTAQAVIQTASIDTRVPERDKHLRSADFLEVEHYPTITFTSTQVTEATPTHATLHGVLTLHGVEQPVALDLVIHGVGKDPWGHVRAGFTATTTISRKAFGLTWNKVLEAGQLLVGEDVEITLDIEGLFKTTP